MKHVSKSLLSPLHQRQVLPWSFRYLLEKLAIGTVSHWILLWIYPKFSLFLLTHLSQRISVQRCVKHLQNLSRFRWHFVSITFERLKSYLASQLLDWKPVNTVVLLIMPLKLMIQVELAIFGSKSCLRSSVSCQHLL